MGTIDNVTWLLLIVIFSIASFIFILIRNLKRPKQGVEVVPEAVEGEELQGVEVVPEAVEGEESKQTLRKRTRRAPIDRGGRPRSSGIKGDTEAQRYEQYQWRPEIICWQRERQWYLGVEVPEDMIDKDLEILQNKSDLTQDEYIDNCWVLREINIPVEIRGEENEEYLIPFGKVNYLIFKLSGSDQNRGCCVKFPSFGSYLVVIPETWERDIELSELPPISPQPVSLKGYRGHFFNLEKGDDRKIALRNEKNELVIVESKGIRFEIVGNRLNDSSEKLGPLFGDGPILIKSLNSRGWTDIGTLVIGEEGSSRGRWRTDFSPVQNELEQELPSEVLSRKGGWYFIRFYDLNDDLIESLDFRFASGLRDIKTPQPFIFPSEEGYRTISIEFSHDSNFNVRPKVAIEEGIEISREVNTTILTIPPRYIFDETSWIVGPHMGPQVEVNILVERIWWDIGDNEEAPSEWKDKPISLSRNDFAATSNKAFFLRFPKKRWIDAVLVGFDHDRARSFNVSVEERTVVISLRYFGDSVEIENVDQDAFLKIWINQGNEMHESTLASLLSIKKSEVQDEFLAIKPDSIGYGRKRRAFAKAILIKGSPQIEVNGQQLWEYFEPAPIKAKRFLWRLLQLEEVSNVLLKFQVQIIVVGSSPNTMQQAKATTHALARALMALDQDLRRFLKGKNDFGGSRVGGLPNRRKK